MLDIFLPLLSSSYSTSVAANGSWTPQPGKRLASCIALKKNFHIHVSWTASGILMENYRREVLFLYLPVHNHIEKAGLIAQTVSISGTVQKAFQIVLFKTSLRVNFTSCFAFFFWNNLSQKNLKVCVMSGLCIFQSGILMSSAKMLHRLVLSQAVFLQLNAWVTVLYRSISISRVILTVVELSYQVKVVLIGERHSF